MALDFSDVTFGEENENDQKKETLQSNFSEAVKINADQHAEQQKLSTETGVPAFAVDETTKQKLNFDAVNFDDLAKNSPKTTDFLSNFDNSVVAQDDTKNLQELEKVFTSSDEGFLGNIGPAFKQGAVQTVKGLGRGLEVDAINIKRGSEEPFVEPLMRTAENKITLTPEEISKLPKEEGQLLPSKETYQQALHYKRAQWVQEQLDNSPDKLSEFGLPSIPTPSKLIMQTGKDLTIWAEKTIDEHPEWQRDPELLNRPWTELLADPKTRGAYLARAIGENTPNLIAAIGVTGLTGLTTKNPALAAQTGMMFTHTLEAGFAYEELVKLAGSEREAAETAHAVGIVNSLLETVPVGRLLSNTPGLKNIFTRNVTNELAKKPMWRKMLSEGFQQAIAEGTTEGLQEVVVNIGKKFYKENQDLFEGVSESAFIGGLLGGSVAVVSQAIPERKAVIASTVDNERKNKKSEVEQQKLDKLNEHATNSKLRERNKESFKQFVEQADGDNNTHVFIDGAQTKLYLQSKTPEEIKADPALQLLSEQADEASRSGGDIQIPVADFAADVAGTEHFDALRDSMTMSGETVAPFRQEQVKQEQEAYVQNLMDEAQKNTSEYVEAQEIFTQVRDQLVDTGAVTPANASIMAQIVPAWATAKARREGTTVQQVYQDAGLTIEGPQTGERARQQGEMILTQVTPEHIESWKDIVKDTALDSETDWKIEQRNIDTVELTEDIQQYLGKPTTDKDLSKTPIKVDSKGKILDGHHRIAEAMNRGDTTITTLVQSSETGKGTGEIINLDTVEQRATIEETGVTKDDTIFKQQDGSGRRTTGDQALIEEAKRRTDSDAVAVLERAAAGEEVVIVHRSPTPEGKLNDAKFEKIEERKTPSTYLGHYSGTVDIGNPGRHGHDVSYHKVKFKKPLTMKEETFKKVTGEMTHQELADHRKKLIEQGFDGILIEGVNWVVALESQTMTELQEDFGDIDTFFKQEVRAEPVSTETEEFKTWSENGEVVEPEDVNEYEFKADTPVVLKVFHGTTHDFDVFDAKRGNLEGQFGAINYFTSSKQDATDNYAGEGPDLTQRIELRAEELADKLEEQFEEQGRKEVLESLNRSTGRLEFISAKIAEMDDHDAADHAAKTLAQYELSGGQETTMELFVKVKNPFVIGENTQWIEFVDNEAIQTEAEQNVADNNDITVEELNERRDEFEDEIDEARWDVENETPNELIEAIQTVSDRHGVEAPELMGQVFELGGEAKPEVIEELLRSSEDYAYADGPEGELIGSQLIAEVIEEMGFDSIILQNAEQRFETMNMESGTAHVHIFDSNKTNIKSTENIGTFDPTDPNIFKQKGAKAPEARGYYDPANSVIRLTEAADLSTFLHEFAHFMYEMEVNGNTDLLQSINNWYKRNADDVAKEASGYLNEKFDALKQDAVVDVTQTEEFRNWFEASDVVDEDGNPLIVYHGTKDDIVSFDKDKTIDGGFHFGSNKQANMRVSGKDKKIIPVYLKAKKLSRSKDTGGNWKSKIKSAKSAGKDGIVYLNRYEGITLESIEIAQTAGINPDKLSDKKFKEWFPEAEDSYIVFEPKQIKSTKSESFKSTSPNIFAQQPVPVEKIKPLSESKFFSQYAQHIDIRNRGKAEASDVAKLVLETGFKKGFNVNAMPPYRGGETKGVGGRFAPKKGDYVYLAPKGSWKDKANGMEIQDGWKPAKYEVIKITSDNPNMYEEYLKSIESYNNSQRFAQEQDVPDFTKPAPGSITADDVVAFLDNTTTGDKAKDAAIRRAVHEQFARGFEQYLMEGKAPSIELRNAFRTFARWLVRIYQSIRGKLNVKLDDQMRAVFDRMIATEEQIQAAEARAQYAPMFTDAAMAGMTEEQFAAYQKRQEKVKDVETETLRDKLIKQLTRQTKKWWNEEKSDIVDEETEKLKKERVYIAREQLKTGDIKMDHATVKDMVGFARTDKLGRKATVIPPELSGMTAKGQQGVHPDEAAAFLGYNSGSEMIDDLINAPKLKDAAETAADAIMIERHGDIFTDGTIEREADDAVQNEERGELILAELKTLAKGTNAPTIDRATIKDMAITNIGKLSFREIHPAKYRRAEIRAAQESARMLAEGNKEGAAEAKLRQVMNYYLGMEATKAKNETMKIVDRMARYKKKKVREEIMKAGNDYWEQLVRVLNRFEFRKAATLKDVDSINLWAKERMETDGDGLVLSNAVLNESYVTHWKNIPFSDLQGINDSVKNIEHVARYANKIKMQQEEIDFNKLKGQWVDHINEQNQRFSTKSTRSRMDDAREATVMEHIRKWASQLTKVPFLASWLDGGERAGMSHDILVQQFTDALDVKMKMVDEVATPVMEAIDSRSKEDQKRHNTKIWIPEIEDHLMGHQVLAVALNVGNQGNLKKMLLGEGWADPEVETDISLENPKLQAVLSHMTKSDWELVQKIWDQMDILYPQLAEVHRRTTGLTPPKVEAVPVETEFGTFRGGYYPVKYSPKRSHKAEKNAEKREAETESMFNNTASIQASVNAGATNERTGFYDRVHLSLEVVPEHFNETIHYITHHDAVRQVNRLIQSQDVADAISGVLGEAEYKQLKPWLNDIAKDGRAQPVKTYMDEIFQRLRFGTTLGVMGFKASTGIMQLFGLLTTAAEVGTGPTVKAIYKTIGRSWYMKAVRRTLGSVDDIQSSWDYAAERSKVMNHRTKTMDREIKNAMSRLTGKTGILAATQEVSMKHIALIQTYMVDLPTWHAAYMKEISESGDEAKAVKYADWAVENLQGSGATKDMATILRNQNKVVSTMTMFMTFFSSLGNLTVDMMKGRRSGLYSNTGTAAKIMFLFVLPVFMEMLMRGELDEPDDEDDRMSKFTTNLALYPLTSVPFIRDAASGLIGDYGYNSSPVASIIEKGIQGYKQIGERALTDEEITKGAAKNAIKFTGVMMGIPGMNQAWATGEHLYDVIENGEDFTTRELLFGPKR